MSPTSAGGPRSRGLFGVRRFVDFQRNLGVARNLLSDRLGQLVAST